MWTTRSMAMWVLGAALMGCGDVDTSATDEGADFDSTDTQEARAASWERLVGAWEASEPGLFSHLVFTNSVDGTGHHYFGLRVVQCVRAPCDPVRQDGSFTAGSSLVTLRSPSATLRLSYSLQGDLLVLRSGGRDVARLRRNDGYCSEAADCYDQGIPQPRCIGSWTCQANACAFRCGRPDPCASTRCPEGQHCSAPADAPMCVADDPMSSCAAVRCIYGTRCDVSTGRARCVPPGDPCATVRCASGTRCVASGGTATCVAEGGGYGAMCGGIAGLRCASGFTCVLEGSFPDASGVCHALSNEGGSCGGGSIRYPAVCATGLRCVGPAPGGPIGSTGTCRR